MHEGPIALDAHASGQGDTNAYLQAAALPPCQCFPSSLHNERVRPQRSAQRVLRSASFLFPPKLFTATQTLGTGPRVLSSARNPPLSFGRPQCAACTVHCCERRGQLPFCSAVSALACSGWSSSSNDCHWNVRLHLADCTAAVEPCAAPLRMRTDMSTTERHPRLYRQGESKGSR